VKGHQARKRFGQHFLTDRFVIDAIVDAIDPQPNEFLVEIGPGLGALTKPLLDRCGRLTVIELDRDLAKRLRANPSIDVIEADALKVDIAALAAEQGQCLRVVGNLPYNISTPILFHLLGSIDSIVDQHVMLQREVVERMVAAPGSKVYGRLSVMLQWRCDIEALFDVEPESFDPPPRVRSAVVRLRPSAQRPPVDVELLQELVSVAFSQRRKLLRNTLGPWLVQRASSPDFDLQRRAEEVSVNEYVELCLATQAAIRMASPLA
jgi:16S rRNA (adenine1518-N6/adenine1519-N6)-dimethyltransferase